jgi:dihydrofolate reductase
MRTEYWYGIKIYMSRKPTNSDLGQTIYECCYGPSSFDEVVKTLRLSPNEYEQSTQLKAWVQKNKDQKYVTHRPESLEWGPFEAIGSDLVDSVRRIKARKGTDLVVTGSSTLTSVLLDHGLADEWFCW